MNRGRGGKLKDVTLYAREHSLIEAMRDPLLDPLAREIYTQQKAQELLDLMCVQAPRDSLWDFFENFYKRYSGEVPVEIFLGELRDSLGVQFSLPKRVPGERHGYRESARSRKGESLWGV